MKTTELNELAEYSVPPKVMVVTLNWNTSEETIECLESLRRVVYANFELTIVENGSDDDSLSSLEAFMEEKGGTRVRTGILDWKGDTLDCELFHLPTEMLGAKPLVVFLVQSKKNYGFPGGNNIGISVARSRDCEYVLFLNNDTVADRLFIDAMVAVALRESSVGIAGSKVYYYDSPNVVQTVGGTIHWASGRFVNIGNETDRGQYNQHAERDFVFATSMLVRMAVFDAVGTLDEFFVFGIEEFDFCTRAKHAGYDVVYVPESKIWHKAGRSARKLADRPETLALIRKNRGFLGLKYELVFFSKHLGFPRCVVPMLLRGSFVLSQALQNLILIKIGRNSFTRESPLGGVGILQRLELRQIMERMRTKRR